MPTVIAVRAICLLAALLLLAGCPRQAQNPVVGDSEAKYPWQMPDSPYRNAGDGPPHDDRKVDGQGAIGQEVQIPNDKGRHPALDTKDNFDPSKLAGDWVIVCHVVNERVELRGSDNFSVASFFDNGTLRLQPVVGGNAQPASNGTWEKSAPGVMLMGLDNSTPQTFYCQFSGDDFFYMWTFEHANGLWLVRKPEQAADRVMANEFTFTSGEKLHLTSVNATAITGSIEGPRPYEVHGFYSQGVMNLRWVNELDNVDGFAAFRVSPDWQTLDGVWWLNNYEAAPFGGRWQTAGAAETLAGGAK
jgi:hypothetical protein